MFKRFFRKIEDAVTSAIRDELRKQITSFFEIELDCNYSSVNIYGILCQSTYDIDVFIHDADCIEWSADGWDFKQDAYGKYYDELLM